MLPNKFNEQFMFYQDKDNSVLVSIISGCHRLTTVLAGYSNEISQIERNRTTNIMNIDTEKE